MENSLMLITQTLDPARCAEKIRNAEKMAVLSGAGISTAAGIPDFRGPRGLYVTRRYDPDKVFEISAFRGEPHYFYEFTRDFVTEVRDVKPTFTHYFLAELEKSGPLTGIITQNIDTLHQLAGSRNVLELHGSYRSASCSKCGKNFDELTYRWWEKAMLESSAPPVAFCSACGGVLKPDIVFFGEMVNGFNAAERLIAECDLLLVLGSSLAVSPASSLPTGTQATTIVVNSGEVMLPPAPHRYFIDQNLDVYFRAVAEHLPMSAG
ncbi:MAG: Sir2 family NAD-dependent protein deacetylase [Deltaproteobacteria bacterium]|nr:Sir2 family NAD-dependent protein deacetylase [Deltaproteobacteria bacterium]